MNQTLERKPTPPSYEASYGVTMVSILLITDRVIREPLYTEAYSWLGKLWCLTLSSHKPITS